MAKLTLNGVDALTESGGTVTIPAATNLNLGTGAVPTAAIQDDAVTSAKLDTNIAVAGTLGVTGAATLSSTLAVTGNATFTGDLTVNGTTTTISTQTVEVEDNILQLNTTQGSPDTATATTSGISIYRGNGVTQASLIFDDADDTWDITNNLKVAGSIQSGDLILKSPVNKGHYTIWEEEEYLAIKNEHTGKKYKFVLEEIND